MSFEFFAEVGDNTLMDALTDPDTLMKSDPLVYKPRFDAIADLRSIDDGSLHRGNEFRRVASLVNIPLSQAMKIIQPEFLKDKKIFYGWLDRGNNKAYCTYDRRRHTETGDGLFWGFKEKEIAHG